MNADLQRLTRWLHRAQPPRRALLRALGAGLVASATNVALLTGAVALLVASAARPGLAAVLGPLILIELMAFMRSPLRFAERMSAHRLGYEAVTRWRQWLVTVVGGLDYSRWRRYASGELLERALRDTDELQDLWLRSVIPLATTLMVMALSDVVVAVLIPRGSWWTVVGVMVLAQFAGVIALVANFRPLLSADRNLRRARGAYRAELVELSTVTPELTRLGRFDHVLNRSDHRTSQLRDAEDELLRRRRRSELVGPVATSVALCGVGLHPRSAPVWIVVAAMLALATYDALSSIRSALDTAVAVSGGAERLEELGGPAHPGHFDWPDDVTVHLEHVTIHEGGVPVVLDSSLALSPGRRVAITGASGSGKSTLLRAVAALDAVQSGSISIGRVPIDEIDEVQLRRHLIYVPSEPGLTRGFVTDVIKMGRATERDSEADLAALGIPVSSTARWEGLSRGETERVAIARAMVTNPQVYVLDEPTSGLGVEETASVLALLAVTGAAFLVATHDPQVVAWCDEEWRLVGARLERISR